MGAEKYPHIFSPGRIGALEVKNRIKYAATETNFPYADGFVSDREVAYMEAQARGGAGIVTTQGAYPDEKGEGKGFRGSMSIAHDRFVPGLARIAEAIKKHGALSCLQILHCGREGGVDLDYCVMPTAVPQRLSYFKPPRELTLPEIKQSVTDHVRAARRAVDAGFDMIEISGIVGYLLSTFVSAYTNKRQDEYGGATVRERCRLMIEMIQAIRAEVGDKVPVGIRLCGAELIDDRGGNTLEQSVESFRIAEEAGADYLSVTVGWHESSQSIITRDVAMGAWLWVAKEVKKVTSVPVMMAFRQFLPKIPEQAMTDGMIDFWEACRPMIADPEIPRKAAEGRADEIVPCIACNLCFSRLYYHQPIGCSVRPSVGHEAEPEWGYYGFSPALRRKKIGIVGGGPAGLQCAAVAAKRGHEVILWEKAGETGGAVCYAARVDQGEEELLRPVRYLEGECRRAGVDLRIPTEATPEELKDLGLDAVVIATGAVMRPLGFPVGDLMVLTPEEIIGRGRRPTGKTVIIGGEGLGMAIAVYLLNRGDFELTIVEEAGKLGRDVNPFYLWRFIKLFKERKVAILRNSRITGTTSGGLRVISGKEEKTLEATSIILALRDPALTWKGVAPEVHLIGDAKRPRRLNNAIHDGYKLGMAL